MSSACLNERAVYESSTRARTVLIDFDEHARLFRTTFKVRELSGTQIGAHPCTTVVSIDDCEDVRKRTNFAGLFQSQGAIAV
tara:strand:- start:455 stop:700 length:246 start_codon:yes stop_codon:yes gene_type:complete